MYVYYFNKLPCEDVMCRRFVTTVVKKKKTVAILKSRTVRFYEDFEFTFYRLKKKNFMILVCVVQTSKNKNNRYNINTVRAFSLL